MKDKILLDIKNTISIIDNKIMTTDIPDTIFTLITERSVLLTLKKLVKNNSISNNNIIQLLINDIKAII